MTPLRIASKPIAATPTAPRRTATRSIASLLRFLIAVVGVAPVLAARAEPPLPALNAHPDRVTVSGLSSGGYMAVQLAVAHSTRITGVGVVAGGPYYCVGQNWARIEDVCMEGAPESARSVADADRHAEQAQVDPTNNLRRTRAWVLAGSLDKKVLEPVVRATHEFFVHYNPSAARYQVLDGLAHGLPVGDSERGVACAVSEPPFLNRCGEGLVAQMLSHVTGAGAPPAANVSPQHIVGFDQREFIGLWQRWWSMSSLDATGFVFIPPQCRQGTRCRIHVALHGCRQGQSAIGRDFVQHADYNGWAVANNTIVLYPQVQSSRPTPFAWWLPFNENGCWDWWGYTGPQYAMKGGLQVRAVMAMVDRLAAAR